MLIAKSLVWVLLFILAALAMLVFVPRRDILKLLPFGTVGGFILAMLVQIAAIWYLRIWKFNFTEIASWRGIPIFLAAAWMPVTIVFGYWLLQIRSTTGRFFYIAGFAIGTALLEFGFVLTGYRAYLRFWNIFYTAVLAIVIHYILGWYLLSTRDTGEHKVIPMKE